MRWNAASPEEPGVTDAEGRSPSERLDSWKDIAAYLQRDVSTVQRWEKREGMPVHRHVHGKLGSVYAFKAEVDAWWRGRACAAGARRGCSRPRVRVPRWLALP